MQFNTGNPNLVGHTRLLAGDPTDSPDSLYELQEVKDAINVAYEELFSRAKQLGGAGWGKKGDYLNSVADQIFYDISSLGIDGRITDVIIETSGKSLRTDTSAVWTYLTPSEQEVSLRDYREGGLTTSEYYILRRRPGFDRIGIVAPPSTAGTDSIRVEFEEKLTLLQNDGDTPIIPSGHHSLLCFMAAISLRISKDLPTGQLLREIARRFPLFLEVVEEPLLDLEHQAVAVGRVQQSFSTRSGFMTRT